MIFERYPVAGLFDAPTFDEVLDPRASRVRRLAARLLAAIDRAIAAAGAPDVTLLCLLDFDRIAARRRLEEDEVRDITAKLERLEKFDLDRIPGLVRLDNSGSAEDNPRLRVGRAGRSDLFAQLVGVPGAGKSTLVRELVRRHPERVSLVVVPQERVGALVRRAPVAFVLALLRLAPIGLLLLTERRDGQRLSARIAPLAPLLNALVRYAELRRHASGDRLLLFDEFVLQRLLGLFAHRTAPLSRWKLRLALFSLRAYAAVPLYLELDPAEAEKRVSRRAEGWPRRWRSLSEAARRTVLQRQTEALEELFLFTRGGARIRVDGAIEESVARADAALARALEVARRDAAVGHFVFNLAGYGGAALQARTLTAALPRVESILFSVDRGRRHSDFTTRRDPCVRVVHLPARPWAAIPTIVLMTRIHRLRVYHCHGFVGVGLVAGWILRRRLVLKTTLLGSDDLDSLGRRPHGERLQWLALRADRNVVLSEALAQINRRQLGSERVVRIPNGVVTRGSAAARPRARTEPEFCVVGLVCARKRTMLAIEKFLAAFGDQEAAVLRVVGPVGARPELDEGDDGYAESCRTLAATSRAAKVIFTGPLDALALREVYERSLGILCCAQAEGLPNALLEAMAANCVPIATELGGVAREVIDSPAAGFVIGDDEGLPPLEALVACSAARGPRRRVEEAFAIERLAERHAALYAELLSGHPPRRS